MIDLEKAEKAFIQKVDTLIRKEQKPQATKLVVDKYGITLKEAFDLIEERRKKLFNQLPRSFDSITKNEEKIINQLIFNGNTLSGIIEIRNTFNVDLKKAIAYYHEKYDELRKTNLEDFLEN